MDKRRIRVTGLRVGSDGAYLDREGRDPIRYNDLNELKEYVSLWKRWLDSGVEGLADPELVENVDRWIKEFEVGGRTS